MREKMLITGGRGMLATDLALLAMKRGYEVLAFGHSELDVTRPDQVQSVLESFKPNIVVHTVGLAVDPCESNPQEAHRVHVKGTGLIAHHCQQVMATLVNLSTCGLFGDEHRFYSESDAVILKTEYARSKHQAEQEAIRCCERTYNIRPGWLFGGTPQHKKNFVYQRYLEAKMKSVIQSAGDKFGCPTWTVDLSQGILDLVETQEYGLYHLTNEGGASRYDYVKTIVDYFSLSTTVESVDSTFYPRKASVPDSELLENLRVKHLGLKLLPPWQEAIQRYIFSLKSNGKC